MLFRQLRKLSYITIGAAIPVVVAIRNGTSRGISSGARPNWQGGSGNGEYWQIGNWRDCKWWRSAKK